MITLIGLLISVNLITAFICRVIAKQYRASIDEAHFVWTLIAGGSLILGPLAATGLLLWALAIYPFRLFETATDIVAKRIKGL